MRAKPYSSKPRTRDNTTRSAIHADPARRAASGEGEAVDFVGLLAGVGITLVAVVAVLFVGWLVARWVLGFRVIGSNQVGIVEKWWSSQRLAQGRHHLAARRGRLPAQGLARRHPLPHAAHVPRPRHAAGDDLAGQDRLRLRARRRAAAARPDAGQGRARQRRSRTSRAFIDAGGQRGPQRADPARRHLRLQPGAVHHHHRLDASTTCRWATSSRAEHHPVDGAAPRRPSTASSRSSSRAPTTRRGIVTVNDGPSLPMGDIIAPTVGDAAGRPQLPQQLPGPRGVPRRRAATAAGSTRC